MLVTKSRLPETVVAPETLRHLADPQIALMQHWRTRLRELARWPRKERPLHAALTTNRRYIYSYWNLPREAWRVEPSWSSANSLRFCVDFTKRNCRELLVGGLLVAGGARVLLAFGQEARLRRAGEFLVRGLNVAALRLGGAGHAAQRERGQQKSCHANLLSGEMTLRYRAAARYGGRALLPCFRQNP